ncbi:TPA: toxin [Enterococcus faecalis]|uniref:toxin n=2 Tax=Enterococcus faecalis TaxID=1351 RepID=UPI0029369226|nr:toxin [Enterococcus faecalis]MDV2596375.1 toxin [Enterococcus faecalis]HAP4388293.1 toxin [Enterococcus faecalis]
MNDYEILLDTISKEIPVKEVPLLEETQDTAYYYRGTIFIDKDLSTVAKKERLYEEYGHYKTTVGNILSQNIIENRKQEKAARVYGANEAVSLDDLINAWEIGCKYYWECAEFLGFSPRYVVDAVQYIKEKHGPIFNYKGYQFRFTTETCMEITK